MSLIFVSARINEWTGGQTEGRKNERMDGQTDGRTNGRTDGGKTSKDGRSREKVKRQMESCKENKSNRGETEGQRKEIVSNGHDCCGDA